jgi:TonB-dependent starch-binding outer membrane protein SusC
MLMKLIYDHKGMCRKPIQNLRLIRIARSLMILIMIAGMPLMSVDAAAAQPQTVTGTVIDDAGVQLPGVYITVKGTTRGSMTDADGKYSIEVDGPDAILVFSFVGTETQEITVGSQTSVNVTLVTEAAMLQDIVVIGYGSVKKSDLTGSVSSLKQDEMTIGMISSVDEMMLGQAAGVQVIQSSGEPGGAVSVRIRGASSVNAGNEPLYVIDGMPIDNSQVGTSTSGIDIPGTRTPRNPLATINPTDIESIEILKDASSTAIYGARGANGVILITTKKGTSGKMRVTYNGYRGFQSVAKKLDLLNAEDYMSTLNAILDEGGGNPEERVTEIQDGGTDWQDEIFRTAAVQSHNLSMSGGNDASKYYLALNYFDQDGVLIGSGIKRYDVRVNYDNKIGDKFHTGMNLTSSYVKDEYASYGFSGNEAGGLIYGALNFDPTMSVYNADGTFQVSPYHTIDNPMALAEGEESVQDAYRTLGTVFGEYFILPEWSIKLNVGADFQNKRRDAFVSSVTKNGAGAKGMASVSNATRSNYLVEATTHYNKTFGIHSVNAVAGITAQEFFSNSALMTVTGFASEVSKTNSMQSGDPELDKISTGKSSYSLLSYIGRVNYSLMDNYLITATIRADGSSRFGENNKWGYFPSVAFAWKMMNESFIQNLNVFSNLKMRASWGQTGNQAIGNYQSLTTFGTGPTATLDQGFFTTYDPSRIGNPDLKWETTEQINIGFDFGFLDNRIYATVDWYQKNTTDMLLNLPVPASSGFGSVKENIGSIKNSGIEFMINTSNLVGEFKWNTSLNLTTIKNEVVDLGPIPEIIHVNASWSGPVCIIRPGEPLNSFYGWNVLGVWQDAAEITASGTTDPVAPGDTKYEDVNGDGSVNADDKVILGNSFPTLTWGLSNSFSYKGFNLSVFIEGVHGIDMHNVNLVDTYFPVNFRRNKFAEPYLNRWTASNPTNDYPSMVNPNGQGNKGINSWTVLDASYIKIRNVKLGYTVPVNNVAFINRANIYVSGQNLMTFTDYPGFDPANNANGESSAKIDYNSYPAARTIMVGVELSF